MKILHTVEFYYPSVGGAQEVVKQLSEHMASKGHDVTVATTKLPNRQSMMVNGVVIKEFDISGNDVRGYKGDVGAYKQFLVNSDFDVIMNYAAQQWATDLFIDVMDKIKAKKVLVPCGFSGLYDPAYKQYFERMPEVLKKYDATVYLAENYRDIDFAREHKVTNTHLIPNGADEQEFADVSEQARQEFRDQSGIRNQLIVSIGNHTTEKGHTESLLAFLLAPIRNATLVIVGGYGECARSCKVIALAINAVGWLVGKRVRIMDLPRDDTVAALKAADIFLFLSNIEASPLVLFEAAAAGVPFISTDVGNAAEIADWTCDGLIAPTVKIANGRVKANILSAARMLADLAKDAKLRRKLGKSGREAWMAKYSWDKISDAYLDLYKSLVGAKS